MGGLNKPPKTNHQPGTGGSHLATWEAEIERFEASPGK
jgi:hypothetical protein